MPDVLRQLFQRLFAACNPALSMPDHVQRCIQDPLPISPWDAWTLVCLVRHRARQQFVADTIQFRLGAELDAIAIDGTLGHPPGPKQGLVPGMTEWEYDFHGKSCCLTHRGTGESIDVDFHEATADWFDDFFYLGYLESLRLPLFPEERLLGLHPSRRSVLLAFDELRRLGFLEKHPESKVVRLHFDYEGFSRRLEGIDWNDDGTRSRIALALGDWLHFEGMPQLESLNLEIRNQVTQMIDRRTESLVNRFKADDQRPLALDALDDLKSPALPELLQQTLAAPITGTTLTALAIIQRSDDVSWCNAVDELMNRADPNGDVPEPSIWLSCAEFLLRHEYCSDVVSRRLKQANHHSLGEAALLALEFAVQDAVQLFRRALRSETPMNRIVAASILALLDRPWSHRELVRILEESDDQLSTAECRAALLECRSNELHQVVHDWEVRNPHEPEQGEWITIEEGTLRNQTTMIQWEMQKWHDRVLPLRSVFAHDPP